MRRFEFVDDSSSKFWEMDYTEGETSFTVTYGRIGTAGQTQTKEFPTAEKAALESAKLVKEKTGKGYRESGVAHAEGRSTDELFAGRPVGDFPATTPSADVAVRINIGWDDETSFADLLAQLAAHPDAATLEALVIGAWESDSLDDASPVISGLIEHAASFPNLKALFFGDTEQERSEISWIDCGNQVAVAHAFPGLEVLHIRGNGTGVMTGLSMPKLHTLIIETGGLLPKVVADVLAANLPALRHLELWLGDSGYGGETTVADLAPLLEGKVHTGLEYLGLRNSEIADEVAFAVSRSPIVASLTALDFSLGTIGDEGYLALTQMGETPKLRTLNVSRHYAGAGAVKKLKAAMKERGVAVDTSDHHDDDDEDRYVSISE
jgi:predicted DNA-binding WGR domain protein